MQSKAFYKTVSHFTKLLVPYQTVLNNSRNLSYFIAVPHDWTRNYSSKQFEGNQLQTTKLCSSIQRDHRQKFVYVGNRIKIISFRLLSYCLSTNQKVPEYPFILYVKQSYQHTTSIQGREFFLSLFKQAKKTNSCCSIQ